MPGPPLQPLPIIATPFERVDIDIVSPLPKASGGHMHILVLASYAMRYPEVVALRSTTDPALARELAPIFYHVGFPHQILTDQGTRFYEQDNAAAVANSGSPATTHF